MLSQTNTYPTSPITTAKITPFTKPTIVSRRMTRQTFALVPAPAVASNDPPLDEQIDFVFEVVDIGFCQFPDIPMNEMRAIALESAG